MSKERVKMMEEEKEVIEAIAHAKTKGEKEELQEGARPDEGAPARAGKIAPLNRRLRVLQPDRFARRAPPFRSGVTSSMSSVLM